MSIDYESEVPDLTKTFYEPEKTGWICKPSTNCEVQRQCYTGFFEVDGEAPPTERDHLSFQLENAMIMWQEDRGKKWLATYATNASSTFVERVQQ